MAAENAKKQNEELENKGPSVIKKFLPLILAGLNLTISGAALYLIYTSTLGWERPSISEEQARRELASVEEEASKEPVIYTMEPFVVNLDGPSRRAIRLEVNLELLDEDAFREVVTMGPEARDSIVRILNKTTFQQIESIQGKLFLKDQILVAINDILLQGSVKDVFFSDFVIQ